MSPGCRLRLLWRLPSRLAVHGPEMEDVAPGEERLSTYGSAGKDRILIMKLFHDSFDTLL